MIEAAVCAGQFPVSSVICVMAVCPPSPAAPRMKTARAPLVLLFLLFVSVTPSSAASCSPGEYAIAMTCYQCAPGLWTNLSAPPALGNCSITPIGHYNNLNGSAAPIPCPAETYQNATGQTACVNCTTGLYAQNTGNTACGPAPICPPGKFASPIYCYDCYAGQASSLPNQTVCDECVAGLYANANRTACISCPPGSISTDPFENAACENCTTGRYKSIENSSTCELCPVGQVSNATGLSSCAPCIAGLFQNVTGSLYCVAPPAGAYVPTTGASSPTLCPLGTFASTPYSIYTPVTVCQNATAGYFSGTTGQTMATPCTPGTWSNTTGLTACYSADPGYYSSFHYSSQQVKCPVGRYANATGSTICQLTPPGTFSASEGASIPSNCAPGYFSVALGSASCTPCGTGSISAARATVCTDCDVGTFALTLSVCQACSPGQFAAYPGQFTCSSCPPGRFADVSGLSSCYPCVAGKHQASWLSTSCVNCSVGFFSLSTASAACEACDAGRSSLVGSTSCFETLAPTAAPTITTQSPTAQIPSAAEIDAGPQEQTLRLESSSRGMELRASFRLVNGGAAPYPVTLELFDGAQAQEKTTVCSAPTGVSVLPIGTLRANATSPIRIGLRLNGVRWTSETRHIRTCIENNWAAVNATCLTTCKSRGLRVIGTLGVVDLQEEGDLSGFTYQTGQIAFNDAVIGLGESTDQSTRKCLPLLYGCECQYSEDRSNDQSRSALLIVAAALYLVAGILAPWYLAFQYGDIRKTPFGPLSSTEDGNEVRILQWRLFGTAAVEIVAGILICAAIFSWPRSDADPSALLYDSDSKRDFAVLGSSLVLFHLITVAVYTMALSGFLGYWTVTRRSNGETCMVCDPIVSTLATLGVASLFVGLFQLLSLTGTRTEALAAKWTCAAFGGIHVLYLVLSWTSRCTSPTGIEILRRLLIVLTPLAIVAATVSAAVASTYHACSDGPSPDATFGFSG